MSSDSKSDLERGTWTGKLDFILSCVGYAVGLGNIWRFPYMAYRNGGATFLIPYVIMLIIAGLPLFFMELALGQFASEGPVTVWKVSPIFTGIGFGMITISAMVCVYYNVIITYAVYYMFVSLVNLDLVVPWSTCDNKWNTDACRTEAFPDHTGFNESAKLESMYADELYNRSCVANLVSMNVSLDFDDVNTTMLESEMFTSCRINYTSASSEYWTRFVLRLHESTGIHDLGDVSLKLVVTLILAWILIFFCLMKGVKSTGKVVYFTATFPYVILVVLLVRGLTLPGFMKGINFYIIPKPERLLEPKVWGDAATQIFYSLGVGFGALPTMASYNKFKNNCYRDAILVAIINCATSIFAGFAIFSLLGFMAHTTNQDIDKVVDQGPGLAFIAYPEGLARLPVSPLWAFLFFFMILTLGLDSQFAMMETVISGITDIYPHFLRKHKASFTFLCCLIGFLLGIPQVTTGGVYILTLMDWYSGSYNLMLLSLAEIICLMAVYGVRNFMCDIEMMIGHKPNVYWIVTWCFFTPLAILFILVVSGWQYQPAGYGDYIFPPWAQGIGWVMVSLPLFFLIVVAFVQIKRYGFKNSLRPTSDWGPKELEYRTGRYTDHLDGILSKENNDYVYTIPDSSFMDDKQEKGDNYEYQPSHSLPHKRFPPRGPEVNQGFMSDDGYQTQERSFDYGDETSPPPDYASHRKNQIELCRL